MSSYLSTMPLVLAVRRASAGKECRPYLCQVGYMTTDSPHTCIRPVARVGSATSAGQLSEGTMTWRPGQHLSYHSSPPGKTFSRCLMRVLKMRSCACLLTHGGSELVSSGSSGIDQTEQELRNLNGARADPTEEELGSLNGARVYPTEQELGNWNGVGADPTEQELGNLNGARADPTEHELGNWNGAGANPTE
ncbi:hypothetical protein GW17_00051436 [Ensete ventricosum]|nr:hypothetical protein GW17_00051436 [Ensete ventricosum]